MNSFWWGKIRGHVSGINWLKWDKLAIHKRERCMSFKNISVFNLSIFGKQGWRLLSNMDNLVTRISKAKYFFHSDFLSANLGQNPNYVWIVCMSIWNAKPLLQMGLGGILETDLVSLSGIIID